MVNKSWGGNTTSSGYTDDYAYSNGIGLPSGRAMLNGSTAVLITTLLAYVAGRSAARSISLQLGSAVVSAFSVAAGGAAASTGYKSCSTRWLVNGGSARFTVNSNGYFYFGRGGSGTVYDSYGSTWSGLLGGAMGYVQSPTAPTGLAISNVQPDGFHATWKAPSDTGDSGITGYLVQVAPTASFTNPTNYLVGNVLAADIDGLAAGGTFYVRVCAMNLCTTTAGTYGPASSYVSTKTSSGAYVGDGTNWPSGTVLVGDGTNWNDTTVMVGDGTNWNPAQ